MIDLSLAKLICAELQAEFSAVYVGRPMSADDIVLPAILVDIESDVVVGSPLQRGTLTVSIQSSATDDTADEHAELAQLVDAAVRALNIDESEVRMWPPVANRVAEDRQENRWITTISYTIGFQGL